MSEKEISNLSFTRAFYKLFLQHESSYFAGSKDQAQLYMQVEFDKYIPRNYIDNAFKVFIEHGLIRKTKVKLKVAPVISGRFGTVKFYPLMQQKYERVENSNIEERLEHVSKILKSFEGTCKDFPTIEDIKLVRSLETEKGIRFTNFCWYNRYSKCYNMTRTSLVGESDSGDNIFYQYDRAEIHRIIEELKRYDPEKEQQQKEEGYNNFLKLRDMRIENWSKFVEKVEKFLSSIRKDQIKVSLKIQKKVSNSYQPQYSKLYCIFSPTVITIKDKELTFASNDFEFFTSFYDIFVNSKTNTVYFFSLEFVIAFEIQGKENIDYLEFLQFYKAQNIKKLDDEISESGYHYHEW